MKLVLCVGYCYWFGVLLHHCVAAIGLFLNEKLCLFHHKSCVLIWNVLNSGRDFHDNNVRNVGNIFVSFHADDVVIL